MKPYYEHAGITIYHGDCREILPALDDCADVLVTDPPYGIGYKSPGSMDASRVRRQVTLAGDDAPFDPAHLIAFASSRKAIVFGANNFAMPPNHGWIVWDKRLDSPRQTQGDAELAWTNFLGATRIIRCMWNGGGTFIAENGSPQGYHPTQKPEKLMRECIQFASETGIESVCDPYMGSGTTLKAAKAMKRKAIGIELEERYCEIAAKRLSQEVLFA